MTDYLIIEKLIIALVAGYVLGSIPFAHAVAWVRGVDIFSTGNRKAGTANVFWNVGHRIGTLVFLGDISKGAAAVVIAQLLGLPEMLVLVAGGAAVLGHWKSVFSKFRGGDGMAPLMGVTIALVPDLALVGIAAGLVTMRVLWRTPLRSAWAIVICFNVMLGISQYYSIDRDLVGGMVVLASLVLLRSIYSRRRRAHAFSGMSDEEALDMDLDLDLDLNLDLDSDSDLMPPAPENP